MTIGVECCIYMMVVVDRKSYITITKHCLVLEIINEYVSFFIIIRRV